MNKKTILMALALAAVALAWLLSRGASSSASDAAPVAATQRGAEGGGGSADSLRYATFAGGCFWCVEEVFDGIDGVVETTSGYTGGATDHPSYEQVSSGGTGHAEAVRVTYDPARVEKTTHPKIMYGRKGPIDSEGVRAAIDRLADALRRNDESLARKILFDFIRES